MDKENKSDWDPDDSQDERQRYTKSQAIRLEKEFSNNKYPTRQEFKALSKTMNVSERKIQVWFQNRRARQKRIDRKASGIPENPLPTMLYRMSTNVGQNILALRKRKLENTPSEPADSKQKVREMSKDGQQRKMSNSNKQGFGVYRKMSNSQMRRTGSYRKMSNSQMQRTHSYRKTSSSYGQRTGSYRKSSSSQMQRTGSYRKSSSSHGQRTGSYSKMPNSPIRTGSYRKNSKTRWFEQCAVPTTSDTIKKSIRGLSDVNEEDLASVMEHMDWNSMELDDDVFTEELEVILSV